jgi:starch synthase
MTSLVPLYIKKAFKDNPLFADTKIVMSIYDDDFKETLHKDFGSKIKLPGITSKDVKQYKTPTFVNVMKAAIDFSDGVIVGSEIINEDLVSYAKNSNKPFLAYQNKEKYVNAYADFYDKVMLSETIA